MLPFSGFRFHWLKCALAAKSMLCLLQSLAGSDVGVKSLMSLRSVWANGTAPYVMYIIIRDWTR